MSSSLDRFRAETEVTDAEVDRLVTRARPRPRSWRRWIAVGGLGVGLTAYAQIARPPAAASFDGPIDGRTRGGTALHGEGRAEVSGEEVALAAGALTAADGRFVLRTREAEVRGTDALVHLDRDVLGTHVRVERGSVEVSCGAAPARTVNGEHLCPPTSAEGLLARAAALTGEERMEALDAAVALAGQPTTRAEALFQRGLARVDAPAAAIADLEAAEATGASLRPDELSRALARLYAATGRCEAALPRLRSLAVLGADADALAACEENPTDE